MISGSLRFLALVAALSVGTRCPADPFTNLLGSNGAGAGRQIYPASSPSASQNLSPFAQSFDQIGTDGGPYDLGIDHLIGSADYGAVGFNYTETFSNAPGNNGSLRAFFIGTFRDSFSVSSDSLAFGTPVDVAIHATLRASMVTSLDAINGVPYSGDPVHAGLTFTGSPISAAANGHALSVTPDQPFASVDFITTVLVGYGNYDFSGSIYQAQPGIIFDYFLSDSLTASLAFDALPADGNGLFMTATSDPGVTLTFASGHDYSPTHSVPELSATLGLLSLGLVSLLSVRRLSCCRQGC